MSNHSDDDDALFEQLEAELEQDGTFDYYRNEKIRAHRATLKRKSNLATRFQCYPNEKPLLEILSDRTARDSDYLLVFANETFTACQHLMHILRSVVQESSGTYKIYIVDAVNAPFLTQKLNVKTLPTMVPFKNGQSGPARVGLHGLLEDPVNVASVCEEYVQQYIESCFPDEEESESE